MAPSLVSIEIGSVDASTIAATFSEAMTAFDYAAGVLIKVNGAEVAFSAARQTDHAKVYYSIPECADTDVITFQYFASPGPDTNRVWSLNNTWTAPDWRGG